jgi:uncharacterized protein (TIGR01777 family)
VKVLIAGGSGTLGRRMAADLNAAGHDITVLTRNIRPQLPFRQVQWDGRSVAGWATELEDAVVINLAGELVDRRPTPENIEVLTRSRVEPTTTLVEASHRCEQPPKLWLQASSTAIYGDGGDAVITEGSPLPSGPPQMTGVARPWEEAAKGARSGRQVILRTSLVLDTGSPVLDRLTTLVRFGLGGRISTGRQWVSWIHVKDFLEVVHFLITSDVRGVVNVTSPCPVQNKELMQELRRHLNRPWSPPAPAPLVRMGAWAMRSDPALALTGRRCIPQKLQDAGFHFGFPKLAPALDDLLGTPKKQQ